MTVIMRSLEDPYSTDLKTMPELALPLMSSASTPVKARSELTALATVSYVVDWRKETTWTPKGPRSSSSMEDSRRPSCPVTPVLPLR